MFQCILNCIDQWKQCFFTLLFPSPHVDPTLTLLQDYLPTHEPSTPRIIKNPEKNHRTKFGQKFWHTSRTADHGAKATLQVTTGIVSSKVLIFKRQPSLERLITPAMDSMITGDRCRGKDKGYWNAQPCQSHRPQPYCEIHSYFIGRRSNNFFCVPSNCDSTLSPPSRSSLWICDYTTTTSSLARLKNAAVPSCLCSDPSSSWIHLIHLPVVTTE